MGGPFAMRRGTAVAIETNDKGTAMATDHLTCGEIPIIRTGFRRLLLPALSMLLCVSASMSFAADAMSQSVDFDIPAQAMEPALHEWSRQSNVQVMVASDEVTGQRTNGVKGRLTAAGALARLLQQTKLTYEMVGNNTVAVKRVAAVTPTGSKGAMQEQTRSQQERQDGTARDPDRHTQRGALEEVVVTAQKRQEQLQDVPISISVLSGKELDTSTVQGLDEVLSRVPGISINEMFIGGGVQVPVRGVAAGRGLFDGSSPTAYYLDTAPFGFVKHAIGPDPTVYDLLRVEVLRGPQGTLYGASALNGVVRVLTRDANLDKVEIKARTSVSDTEGGGENYRGDMAINVPIVDGKLAARAVLGYQSLSGWIDKPNDKNANDAEIGNVRLKVKAQPTEELSVGLSAWRSRSDYDAMSAGDEHQRHASVIDEPTTNDFDVYGLNLGYEFQGFSITSATSYIDFTNTTLVDQTPQGSAAQSDYRLGAETFAEEITLNSTHGGPWRWSLGGMYRDSEDRYFQNIPNVYLMPTRIKNTSKSYAVFGELTRSFLDDRFEVTGGLRYFEDDLAQRETSRLNGAPPDQLIDIEDKFNATTPRLVLTWRPNEDTSIYASYSEGFRSGAHQFPAVLAVYPVQATEPDHLTNYEVGAKSSLVDGRINFESALYYIDWRDVQQSVTVRVPVGTTFRDLSALLNGHSASGLGFDLGIGAQPVQGLELGVSLSWNDLGMDSDVISGGVVLFDKGDRLNNSSEYTVGVNADYVFPLGKNGFEGSFSTSANYTSEQEWRTLIAGRRNIFVSDSMTIARAAFSVSAPDHWTATLFVDNANNEGGSPAKRPDVPSWSVRVRPRTIGLQLEYHY